MSKVTLKIIDFDAEMERVKREVKEIANEDIRSKIEYATETLKVVTPVDTGEARAGWTSKVIPEMDGTVGGTIVNPVDHIVPLNNGHSKQAPKFFIEQVLTRIGILTPN